MRIHFILFFAILSIASSGQHNEIYSLALSDHSNFDYIRYINHKVPSKILVLDTTTSWFPARFWMEELEGKSSKELEKLANDEHHPYNHTYLFRDSMLNRLISFDEQKALWKKASATKSKKISFREKTYSTVHSTGNLVGFYVITSEPIFSDDGRFAFIEIETCYKESLIPSEWASGDAFGSVCIIYQKTDYNTWKKIKAAKMWFN